MSTRCILYYTRYTYITHADCNRYSNFSPSAYAYVDGYAHTQATATATACSYIGFNILS
jgi:hypothetical protein